MMRKRPNDPDIAKVDGDTRQAINDLARQIAQGAETGSPTEKFALVLSALCVADFAGVLDDLHAIAVRALAHAKASVAERDEAARNN